ncbi:hypothetical protein I2700191B6_29290 [Dorea formicigenerans]
MHYCHRFVSFGLILQDNHNPDQVQPQSHSFHARFYHQGDVIIPVQECRDILAVSFENYVYEFS